MLVSMVSAGQCQLFHLCYILAEPCDAGGLRGPLFSSSIGYFYGYWTFHSTDFQFPSHRTKAQNGLGNGSKNES